MNIQIKKLVKKICSDDSALLLDHDLNITILNSTYRFEISNIVKNLSFNETNRVLGYFIEELEGDGINMDEDEMDNPDAYLSFCIKECGETLENALAYVNEFRANNNI